MNRRKYPGLSPSILLLAFAILFSVPVSGLDRDRKISQFHHTAWTLKDGAPQRISAIAQTNDGYLWLGSANGLYRFDGVQFDAYLPRSGSFPSTDISTLFVTPDDGLWIGYWHGGVSFLKDGNLTNYGESDGLPPGRVGSFVKDDDGVIWVAAIGGLSRFESPRWRTVGPEWNFPQKMVQSAFVDKTGTLWVAADKTVVFLPKGEKSFRPTGEEIGLLWKITQSPDGAIWLAEMSRAVRQLPRPGIEPRSLGPEIRVGSSAILFDREGALWVTSIGDGLRRVPYTDRFRGRKIAQFSTDAEIFTEENGLTANYSYTVFEDREGNIWVGTINGLDRFRASDFVTVQFPSGSQHFMLAAGDDGDVWVGSTNRGVNLIRGGIPSVKIALTVLSVFRDDEGEIWLNSISYIYLWKNGKLKKFDLPFGAENVAPLVLKDRGGLLWAYTNREGLCQLKDGIWSRYDRQSELPNSPPIAGAVDSSDRKWFGFAANKLTVVDNVGNRTFSQDDGLAVGDVKAIQERNGRVWVGGTLGVAVYREDRFRMLNVEGEGILSGVSGIVEARDGSLWLNARRGIIHIPAEEVRVALENPASSVRYRVFDLLDGLTGSAQQFGFPTAVEASDGRLWFSTNKGVNWIDPKKILTNIAPPPVSIRSLTANDKSYEPLPTLELPAGTTSLRIAFTALSLSIPERVRFRYRLEGVEASWQEAGTRREAFYNSLAPGKYQFRVIASNQDGVWNETGATLDFAIKPTFYQTIWFRGLMISTALLLTACILYLFYRWRLARTMERLNIAFEGRLAERTRIAHELHDTLLQGFFGASMRLQGVSSLLPGKSEQAKEHLNNVLDQIDVVLEDGRKAVWDMRSLSIGENDLGQAFRLAGEDLTKTYPTEFSITTSGASRPLHPLVRDQIYRTGREALINAFRHSKATRIEIEIEYAPKYLRVVIRDDGCGIRPEYLSAGRDGHLGLTGMREYAEKIGAELKIWSPLGGGSKVELITPHQTAFVRKSSANFLNRLISRLGKNWL